MTAASCVTRASSGARGRASVALATALAFTAIISSSSWSVVRAEPPEQQDVSKRTQLSTRFTIDPKNPESSVPTEREKDADPLEFGYFLQDLLDRAEAAGNYKQLDVVVAYYRAVAKAVPDVAKGWSKLCEAYENVHMRDKAIRACRYAIERQGSEVGDFQRFVRLEIAKEGPLDPTESAEVAKVLEHLSKTPSLAVTVQRLTCDVAVHDGDVKSLESCSKKLSELQPKDPATLVYRWSLAMKKGEYGEAKRLLAAAKALSIPPESVQRMEEVTSGLRFAGWPKWVIPAALLAIAAAIGWRVRRGRARLAVQ
jgi:tetratricopeptide (TPR) repeat protein